MPAARTARTRVPDCAADDEKRHRAPPTACGAPALHARPGLSKVDQDCARPAGLHRVLVLEARGPPPDTAATCPAGGDVAFRCEKLPSNVRLAFMQPRSVMMAALLPMLRRSNHIRPSSACTCAPATLTGRSAMMTPTSSRIAAQRARVSSLHHHRPPPPRRPPIGRWRSTGGSSIAISVTAGEGRTAHASTGITRALATRPGVRMASAAAVPPPHTCLRCGPATRHRAASCPHFCCVQAVRTDVWRDSARRVEPTLGPPSASDSPAFPRSQRTCQHCGRVVSTAGAGQLGHSSFSRSCSTRTGCSRPTRRRVDALAGRLLSRGCGRRLCRPVHLLPVFDDAAQPALLQARGVCPMDGVVQSQPFPPRPSHEGPWLHGGPLNGACASHGARAASSGCLRLLLERLARARTAKIHPDSEFIIKIAVYTRFTHARRDARRVQRGYGSVVSCAEDGSHDPPRRADHSRRLLDKAAASICPIVACDNWRLLHWHHHRTGCLVLLPRRQLAKRVRLLFARASSRQRSRFALAPEHALFVALALALECRRAVPSGSAQSSRGRTVAPSSFSSAFSISSRRPKSRSICFSTRGGRRRQLPFVLCAARTARSSATTRSACGIRR